MQTIRPRLPSRPKPSQAVLDKRAAMIRHMLNGDWRRDRFQHVEVGCCPGGLKETREKYCAALLGGIGFEPYVFSPCSFSGGGLARSAYLASDI
jgi:hypothetical protein